MRRAALAMIVIGSLAVFPLRADYLVENRGSWPDSWPKELEALRDRSQTLVGPMQPALHYAIPFETREDFEAAWPHLLKVKTKGAPIMLRRGPSFWLSGGKAGVCIHAPPKDDRRITVPKSPAADIKQKRWEQTTYIELIVDGKIVDLNRIELPPDTPFIDERFQQDVKR